MILDINKMVRDFGGASRLSRQFSELGNPITSDGIQKWRRRGTIASKWLIALSTLARTRNQQFDVSEYLKDKNPINKNLPEQQEEKTTSSKDSQEAMKAVARALKRTANKHGLEDARKAAEKLNEIAEEIKMPIPKPGANLDFLDEILGPGPKQAASLEFRSNESPTEAMPDPGVRRLPRQEFVRHLEHLLMQKY